MICDPARIKNMSTIKLEWFRDIGVRGLKGSWKGHRLEDQCKQALKDIKEELKRRSKKHR